MSVESSKLLATSVVWELPSFRKTIAYARKYRTAWIISLRTKRTSYHGRCWPVSLMSTVALHLISILLKIYSKECYGCLLDIGAPVMHRLDCQFQPCLSSLAKEYRNLRLNCRILALDGKILLIRPKLWLANDGNYRLATFQRLPPAGNLAKLQPFLREMRYFTPWREGLCEDFILPRSMQPRQGAVRVPIGDMILSTADVRAISASYSLFLVPAPGVSGSDFAGGEKWLPRLVAYSRNVSRRYS